jgi:hypothetical protein
VFSALRPYRRPLSLSSSWSASALVTLVVLGAGPVCAEWVPLENKHQSHALRTVYIEPTTIRRDEHLVTMEILVDWKWIQGSTGEGGNHRFMSTKSHKQFDCAEKSYARWEPVDRMWDM